MGAAAAASRVKRGQRVAWFAHRRELVQQAAATLQAQGLEVGHSGAGRSAPVQILMAQSVVRRGEVPEADLVVLDEAHHYAADLWGSIPEAYPSADFLGLTATPERGDGRPLDHLFDSILVVAHPAELVELGHLCPVETHRPARIQPKGKLAKQPYEAYLELGVRDRRCIVFAPNIDNATQMAADFRTHAKCEAHVITGALSDETRAARLADFDAGRVRVLINVFVLTEGWDCPSVEVVMLARMFASAGAYMQCVGRGLRPAPGKRLCTLVDLVGTTHVHGDPLEEREYSLDGEGMRRKAGPSVAFCRVCGRLAADCSCGASREIVLLESTNDPLIKFARIRRDSDDEKAARLAKWISEAKARGRKWQSALYRFSGAYGTSAPAAIVSQALSIEARRPWCRECETSKCEHVAVSVLTDLRAGSIP
jgi:superfamily II DNA or RNA helicase